MFQRIDNLSTYQNLAYGVSGLMLLCLVALGAFHKMGGYGVETDFYWAYAPDAQRISQGEIPQEPGVGPGYALVLAGLNLLFEDWFFTGKMISILSTVLAGLFIFRTVSGLFRQRVAFFTLVLWHVTVLPFAIVAGTDMFFALLVAAAIYFLFRDRQFAGRNLVISAAIMGYAYLTRPNAIVLPICASLIVLFFNPASLDWGRRAKCLMLFTAVFVAVLLPWQAILYVNGSQAIRSDSYLIIASHFYGRPGVIGSEDMRLAAEKFDSLKAVVLYDLTHFVTHYLSNIYRHFRDVLIHSLRFPTFLFVGAGALLLLPRIDRRQTAFFVFPALSFLMLCLVHYEPRYYLYLVGFFLLPAVYFLLYRERGEPERRWSKFYLREAAYVMTVLFVLQFSLKEVKKTIKFEPRELVEISKVLRQNTNGDESIIARKPHIGFLANLETKYFPEAKTLSELLQFAESEKADYLIYGEVESKRRPEFKFLLEPENVPREFEPLLVWENPKTVIYKLRI